MLPFEKLYNTVTQWILAHLSPLYLSMLVFVFAVLLFVPIADLKYLQLDSWAVHYRPFYAVGFLVFGFLLVGKTGQHFYRNWYGQHKILQYLQKLSMDEVLLLFKYSESGRRTQYFEPMDGIANNLVNHEVLYVSYSQYNPLKGCPYTLTDVAARYVLDRAKFQKMTLDTSKVQKRLENSN